MVKESKSILELICGTCEDWDGNYSSANGKRFFIVIDSVDGWHVRDHYSQLYFKSVIVVDLMRVCDAMNLTFPQK